MIGQDTDINDIVVGMRDIRRYITFISFGHTSDTSGAGGVNRRRGIKASP